MRHIVVRHSLHLTVSLVKIETVYCECDTPKAIKAIKDRLLLYVFAFANVFAFSTHWVPVPCYYFCDLIITTNTQLIVLIILTVKSRENFIR